MRKETMMSTISLLLGVLTFMLLGTSAVEIAKLTLLVPVLIAFGYGFLCLSTYVYFKIEDLIDKRG